MPAWTPAERDAVGDAEELEIATRRADGSLRRPRTIWVVRRGDDLYVRSVNGRDSDWFRGTRTRHEAQIAAGGVTRDVTLADADDGAVGDELDTVYRAKYQAYPENIVNSIVAGQARGATLRLIPA